VEVDQRDRERKWNSLLNPVEQRTRQELTAKAIGPGEESLRWLDSTFPNLKDASDFQVQSSALEPEFRQLVHIGDSESIFLIFPAATEKVEPGVEQAHTQPLSSSTPSSTYKGQIWFTTAKFMAVRQDAAGLLFYAIALNTLRSGRSEEAHMKETIRKWLVSVHEGKTSTKGLSCLFSYDAVSDVSVFNLGNPKRVGEVMFRNTSVPSATYKVTFGRPVVPERVWLASSFERGPVPVIFCKPYPFKKNVQETLIERQHATRDSEDRVVFSSFVQTKMFVDVLRRHF
jgi:hypothetical protein